MSLLAILVLITIAYYCAQIVQNDFIYLLCLATLLFIQHIIIEQQHKLQHRLKNLKIFISILLVEWFYTTNHKKLGIFYFLFSFFNVLIGLSLASLIRLELTEPLATTFIGKNNSYHIVVAVHAIIMVFFVVTPVVFGGFGNYFLPLQVGARDVAYPRLNNFSVWVLPAGLITISRTLWDGLTTNNTDIYEPQTFSTAWWKSTHFIRPFQLTKATTPLNNINHIENQNEATSFVYNLQFTNSNNIIDDVLNALPSNNASPNMSMMMAGWTFTTPFSHSRFTGRAVDMALISLIFATITSIFTTINLITTWRYLRGRGARFQRELFPIFLISLFIALRLLLLVSPILTGGFVMLIADRHFYTAFFTVRAGGDILLFQHIFWFFGHPEVYILVIPGFGVVSTLVPYYVRKPISSKMHMVYAMHSIGCMSTVVWGHHMYLVGIDNKARTIFMTITAMIALPSTIKICGWIISLNNGSTYISLDLWLAVVFISIFFVGGMSGLMVAGAGLDILLHDTYYVVGHFHVMLSGAMILSIIGWIYFNYRELFGYAYFWLFAAIQLITHTIGHLLCFIPLIWSGYAGMPRRVQDYPSGYTGWHSVATFGHSIVLIGVVSILFLLLHSFYYKRPLSARIQGLPLVPTRTAFIVIDKFFALLTRTTQQILGIKVIRTYVFS